jgi:hypothetical protein
VLYRIRWICSSSTTVQALSEWRGGRCVESVHDDVCVYCDVSILYPNVYHVYCTCACMCVTRSLSTFCEPYFVQVLLIVVAESLMDCRYCTRWAARTGHACYCHASCRVYRVFARVLLPCFAKHLYIPLNGTAEC